MATPTRILLIDDDAVDRAIVRRALRASGIVHELSEASNGAQGLRFAREQAFDCVLLDYHLPDLDASDLLAEMLTPEGGNQAVIILTGESDQEIAFRLMSAGALDYLAKSEATSSSLARAIRYAAARRVFLTELDNARIDAEQKSRALDTLNRQKTLLLSIIAHDLRNPFQSLLGLSDLLAQAVVSQDMRLVERRAQGLGEAAAQAYALVESLFGWASLQMNDVDIGLMDVEVDPIVRQAVDGQSDAAAHKKIVIATEPTGLRARAHPDMLAAILRNLVSNAVKFSHPGGSVSIGGRRSADRIEIDVSDQGIGMDPQTLADLFNYERRQSAVGTAGERGGGLGLLLCHDLAERQQGALRVRSEPGQGSTFSLLLNAAPD